MTAYIKVVLAVVAILVADAHTNAADPQALIVAHRGLLRHAPENTLANFRACLELRIGFEFDVDRRQQDEVELVQFGLMSDFIGQGLGKWFLQWTIDKAWSYEPKRFWLHTCTLDHPAAVPTYKKAGFVQFKEEAIRRER